MWLEGMQEPREAVLGCVGHCSGSSTEIPHGEREIIMVRKRAGAFW